MGRYERRVGLAAGVGLEAHRASLIKSFWTNSAAFLPLTAETSMAATDRSRTEELKTEWRLFIRKGREMFSGGEKRG